jgi:hypothetical protein
LLEFLGSEAVFSQLKVLFLLSLTREYIQKCGKAQSSQENRINMRRWIVAKVTLTAGYDCIRHSERSLQNAHRGAFFACGTFSSGHLDPVDHSNYFLKNVTKLIMNHMQEKVFAFFLKLFTAQYKNPLGHPILNRVSGMNGLPQLWSFCKYV